MANKDLFEQAIADAKKLKEISMANAKQVIEEAFAPKIQEMFRLKLSEMEDLEEDDYTEDGMENELEANAEDAMMPEYAEHNPESEEEAHKLAEEGMEEVTLDEILAELELEEAEGHDAEMMKEAKDEEESEEEEEETEEEESEETEEVADEVAELSIEEFKNLIRDVVADVMGGHEASEAGGEGDLEGADVVPGEGGDDETISLDEILAELEEANQPINEASKAAKHAKKKKEEEAKEKKEREEEKKKEKESLKEAVETINFLKSQLSEINLLNAKLLYVNKIFKAKSLTESQKVKVVTAFDRATTTKEAKNIYETLVDSLTSVTTSAKKVPIKESLGFASKPIGSAPATPIVEADAYVYRMQQLAGIKQPNI